MKKFLLVLLTIIVFVIIAQKIGLSNYFFNSTKSLKDETKNVPTKRISQVISKPLIGFHYRMIDNQTAIQNKLVEGAYITQIIKGSPAEKANLIEEDIVTEIDGVKIGGIDEQTLTKLISDKKSGEQVNLKIWRNKEIKTISVALETTQ